MSGMSVQRKKRDMQIKLHRGKQGLWKEAMESEKTRFQMGRKEKSKMKISVITDISMIYQWIFWYKISVNQKLIKTCKNVNK